QKLVSQAERINLFAQEKDLTIYQPVPHLTAKIMRLRPQRAEAQLLVLARMEDRCKERITIIHVEVQNSHAHLLRFAQRFSLMYEPKRTIELEPFDHKTLFDSTWMFSDLAKKPSQLCI